MHSQTNEVVCHRYQGLTAFLQDDFATLTLTGTSLSLMSRDQSRVTYPATFFGLGFCVLLSCLTCTCTIYSLYTKMSFGGLLKFRAAREYDIKS